MIRFKRWNGCKKLINIWFSSILDLVCKSIQIKWANKIMTITILTRYFFIIFNIISLSFFLRNCFYIIWIFGNVLCISISDLFFLQWEVFFMGNGNTWFFSIFIWRIIGCCFLLQLMCFKCHLICNIFNCNIVNLIVNANAISCGIPPWYYFWISILLLSNWEVHVIFFRLLWSSFFYISGFFCQTIIPCFIHILMLAIERNYCLITLFVGSKWLFPYTMCNVFPFISSRTLTIM
jgi:hypothetical protein